MDSKEIERLSALLDITPVRVRRYLELQERYAAMSHITVVLYPTLCRTDAMITEALGWGPVST